MSRRSWIGDSGADAFRVAPSSSSITANYLEVGLEEIGGDQGRYMTGFDRQRQLALALPRALPAPHHHGDSLIATHKRGQMTLPGATPATACSHEPEQCDQLGHSFQLMAATFFDDEEPGDLALHVRRHQNRAGFRQGLHPPAALGTSP
jgi:hypothetical protein